MQPPRKTVQRVFIRLRELAHDPAIPLLSKTQKDVKQRREQILTDPSRTHAHGSLFTRAEWWKQHQVPRGRGMDTQILTHTHNEISLRLKRENGSGTGYNTDELSGHYASEKGQSLKDKHRMTPLI